MTLDLEKDQWHFFQKCKDKENNWFTTCTQCGYHKVPETFEEFCTWETRKKIKTEYRLCPSCVAERNRLGTKYIFDKVKE